ncbi:MAG TPA: (Fe-S)-binding protein [Anaerolineae bacterium]|nr:(Fe-S)-binding protein [Anaerolineae bacterium]
MNYQSIIQRTRAYLCLDCGKCTGSCPLARVDLDYSPRRIVDRVIFGEAETVVTDPQLWNCMTCGLCSARCPSSVDFVRFIVEMRAEAFRAGERGIYAHDGILQEVMRIQTVNVYPDRLGWLSDEMDVSDSGEYFYFVGCLPYFEVIFANLEINALDIARSAVRLLNRVGIAPAVSNKERCCGTDLLLAGDTDSFRRLAEMNMETIQASVAKKIIFSCAECYNTFRNDYPAYVGQLPFEMMHLTELLADKIDAGELVFGSLPGLVTYHDPCRMCRYLKVLEPPRTVLTSVPGLQLVEMEDNRERAMCCGSTAWVNCSGCMKQIQREKLHQARETGARVMLTTCPKCQIHLSCACQDLEDDQTVKVDDLLSWVSKALA